MSPPAEQPSNLLPYYPAPAPTTAYALLPATPPQTPSSPTPLDNHELNVQSMCAPSSCWERHRHEDWQPQRIRMAHTLKTLNTGQSTLKKFCTCGSRATVLQHTTHTHLFKLASNKCRHRLCMPCQAERGWTIKTNLIEHIAKTRPHLSLCTLTMKHTETHLRPTLKRLIKAFHELRRTLLWKRAVKGGAWVLEIKRSKKGYWHPHIHCLLDAGYIKPNELSAAWLTATGDSTIVDIRRIGKEHGARYVTKYITKPIDDTVWKDQASLEEWIMATRGLRRCSTIGSWRGVKLADPPDIEECMKLTDANGFPQWRELCSFDDLLTQLRRGDPAARPVFDSLTRSKKGPAP